MKMKAVLGSTVLAAALSAHAHARTATVKLPPSIEVKKPQEVKLPEGQKHVNKDVLIKDVSEKIKAMNENSRTEVVGI